MFKNFKMQTKMIWGFGILILLFAITGIIAITSFMNAADGFTGYRELARDTNLAGRLQANMLMTRLNVKDFMTHAEEKDIELYNEYYKQMSGFMTEAHKDIQNPERARLIDDADAKVKEYDPAFKKLITLQNKRDNLVRNQLDVQGPSMEKQLTAILTSAYRDRDTVASYYAGLALRDLLLARLYVVKFLDTNSEAHVERVESEMTNFTDNLKILDREVENLQRRQFLSEIKKAQVLYAAAFSELQQTIYSRNDIRDNTLDVLGPKIASDIEEVKLSVKEEQDSLGPRLQESNAISTNLVFTVCVIALLLGIILAFIITRSILNQLGADPSVIMDISGKIADGDLTINFSEYTERMKGVYSSMKNMVDSLSLVVNNVRNVSEGVVAGSTQLSSSSEQMSQGANEQAASAEEVSASIEEMSANIKQNAENAEETKTIAAKSASDAQKSGAAVFQTVEAMKVIADKISIIQEIARSTNMLALNAAIEAARAGDMGKGFAVVASEVRKLAERSQVAAEEISELSINSVNIAENAGQMLTELVPNIRRTADLVTEITAASNEQSLGASQISKAIGQLDLVIQQNAASAEEMSSTSQSLSAQADELQKSVNFFTLSGGEYKQISFENSGSQSPYLSIPTEAIPVATEAESLKERV